LGFWGVLGFLGAEVIDLEGLSADNVRSQWMAGRRARMFSSIEMVKN